MAVKRILQLPLATSGSAGDMLLIFQGGVTKQIDFANMIVPANASTLIGTTLASGVTSSSLTSVGTLASLSVTGAVTGSSFNSITALSSTTPAALGVAAVGTSTTVARSDHVHLAQTLPTTLPASDVYSWAKAATKPSYAFNEITSAAINATTGTFSGNLNIGNAAILKLGDADAQGYGVSRTRLQLAPPQHTGGEWDFITYDDATYAYLRLGYAGANSFQFQNGGNLLIAGTISASNFSGSHSGASSGTNTGDNTVCTSGTASSVPWSGITGKPTATLVCPAGLNSTSLRSIVQEGAYFTESQAGNTDTPVGGSSGAFLQFADGGGSDVRWQMYHTSDGNRIFVQNQWGAGVWQGWKELTHSGNIASQSVASASLVSGSGVSTVGSLLFYGVGGNSGQAYQSYGIFQETGSWVNPFPDLIIGFHTGIKIGAYSSYGGTRFYNNAPAATGNVEIFSVGNGDDHVRVANNLYVGGTVTGSNLSGTNTGDQTNISGNSATTSQTTWTDIYANSWLRNNNINTGLYNQAGAGHFYQESTNYWSLTAGSNSSIGLKFRDTHASTIRGWFHADTSGAGVLTTGGSWAIRNTTSTSYGSVTLWGTAGGYAGTCYADSGGNTVGGMFDAGGNGGDYDTSTGWHFYWLRANTCLGIGGSGTAAGYRAYVNGSCYVAGNLYASGNVTAYSDRRIKENIITIDKALDKVEALRGVYFNRIDDPFKTRSTGVIAQEVAEVLPEVVSVNSKDEMNVAYGNIVGILIEAIKELRSELNEVKARI